MVLKTILIIINWNANLIVLVRRPDYQTGSNEETDYDDDPYFAEVLRAQNTMISGYDRNEHFNLNFQ